MKRTFLISTSLIIIGLLPVMIGCGGSKALGEMTSAELFEMGKEKFDKGKYFRAVEYFQTVIYNYPGESIVDSAQYYLGLSYYSDEDYELAQIEFNRLILNYPSSVYFENAMLFRAVCAFKSAPEHYALDQANLEQAIIMLEDFIIDFPESDNMPEARTHLLEARTRLAQKNYKNAKVYMFMGAYSAAAVYFQIVIDDYTDTDFAPRALFGLGEALYKKKQFSEARDKFQNFITVYADHELRIKAEEMVIKAAFSDGEHAFKLAKFDEARQSFEDFIEKYPRSGKKDKVDDYLKKIKAISRDSTKVENAGSEIGRTVGDSGRNI